MTTLVLRRRAASLGRFVLLLFLVSVGSFLLLEMVPGSPVDTLVPADATPDQIAAAAQAYGLDKPLPERYFDWIGGVLQGDFGRSFQTGLSVGETIAKRAPVSIEIAVLSIIVALAVSVPIGIWSAYRAGGPIDRTATLVTTALLATPPFVLGILLVYVFAVRLGLLPLLGWVSFEKDPLDHVARLVLPVLTLAAAECVLFTRLLRGDMIATLRQDHVLSARARGLPTWRILVRHSLRQSSFSMVTASGVVIGRLIGGTVLVEAIFALPGMGTLVITAIQNRDFIVVQAIVLLTAVLYLSLNTLVDLTYPLLDPRVRRAKTA